METQVQFPLVSYGVDISNEEFELGLCEVVSSIPEPTRVSSHRMLRQRVLLLWWHNDCLLAVGGMVSRRNA
ncbi:hypothetical protein Hanom_Chr10g00929721 [Helianthus anomalus]